MTIPASTSRSPTASSSATAAHPSAGWRARRSTAPTRRGPGCADVPPNVTFLDIADAVCDPTTCPGELGNVLVYLDDDHLTATYAASMAPLLENQVTAAIGP